MAPQFPNYIAHTFENVIVTSMSWKVYGSHRAPHVSTTAVLKQVTVRIQPTLKLLHFLGERGLVFINAYHMSS